MEIDSVGRRNLLPAVCQIQPIRTDGRRPKRTRERERAALKLKERYSEGRLLGGLGDQYFTEFADDGGELLNYSVSLSSIGSNSGKASGAEEEGRKRGSGKMDEVGRRRRSLLGRKRATADVS